VTHVASLRVLEAIPTRSGRGGASIET